MIKPIGGHASFQSKIHGIKDKDTRDKPKFEEIFPEIQDIFHYPLVAHSLFDKQVLNALSDHFGLGLSFEYIDACLLAKEKLPRLKNHKLKTLGKHFGLPSFKHHDAVEDAIACAKIFLRLCEYKKETIECLRDEVSEFKGIVTGILADDEVNYKEAYELLYWLEDHPGTAQEYREVYLKTKKALEDDHLDTAEALEMKTLLNTFLKTL